MCPIAVTPVSHSTKMLLRWFHPPATAHLV